MHSLKQSGRSMTLLAVIRDCVPYIGHTFKFRSLCKIAGHAIIVKRWHACTTRPRKTHSSKRSSLSDFVCKLYRWHLQYTQYDQLFMWYCCLFVCVRCALWRSGSVYIVKSYTFPCTVMFLAGNFLLTSRLGLAIVSLCHGTGAPFGYMIHSKWYIQNGTPKLPLMAQPLKHPQSDCALKDANFEKPCRCPTLEPDPKAPCITNNTAAQCSG